MNPDQIKEVVESIKTLNLNINDATTQKIADTILPIVKYYLIINFTKFMVVSLIVSFSLYGIYRIFKGIIDNEKTEL